MRPTEARHEMVEGMELSTTSEARNADPTHSPQSTQVAFNDTATTEDNCIQNPQKLRRVESIFVCGQVLLTVFPVLFLALATTAVSLDKKPTSKTGSVVQQAISLSPTVFPIVFAAIIGKFFHTLGLYWAERGIRLGTLERLVGSQTLFGAIERQIVLRGQYILGVSIILLWALSPLGGQSALRLVTVSPKTSLTNIPLRYMPIALSEYTVMSPNFGAAYALDSFSSWVSIYLTALTTSNKYRNSHQDLFGNLRIPSFRPFLHSVNDTWAKIDHTNEVMFSSLLGIPIVGLPAVGNVSFNVVSRYFAIECNASRLLLTEGEGIDTFKDTGVGRGFWAYEQGGTFIAQAPKLPPLAKEPIEYLAMARETVVPFNITSMNNGDRAKNLTVIYCSLVPQDVESKVFCIDKSCKVDAMRRLPLDFHSWRAQTIQSIRQSLLYFSIATVAPGKRGQLRTLSSSITELWLKEPYTAWVPEQFDRANLWQVPLSDLGRNLEILYNTYWQSTFGTKYLFGASTEDVNGVEYSNITVHGITFGVDFNTSQAVLTNNDGYQYICNMTFSALLIIISILLLLASLATLVLMNLTLAPDILGYASSFTRDNPHAKVDLGSHMDGLKRARELRDIKVTIGDVNVAFEVGHIAFTTSTEVNRLEKVRSYD